MTTPQPSKEVALAPCPHCGNQLQAKRGKINPYARCVTPDCFGAKMPVVSLDVPRDVAAWNTRASTPTVEITDALDGVSDAARKWRERQFAKTGTTEVGMRDALELARNRIEYLGLIGHSRHAEANERDFFPPIDRALAALSALNVSEAGRGPRLDALRKAEYVLTEKHLSGWRLCLGFSELADLHAAHDALARPIKAGDNDCVALDAAHQIEALPSDLHESQKTARIQLIILNAMRDRAISDSSS